MTPEDIPVQLGQWLSDALLDKNPNYKNIPSNVIINKLLPGLGATHMEIKSHRHSIIIEPNLPVILGKAEKDKNILPVWKKCTPTKIRKYLSDKNIKYKKLITTPEGYNKIQNIINKGHDYIYNDYFMLFDECEKITQDHDFRENISIPINDFFNKFQNKAFVSATPLIPSDPRFEEQDFRILKIDPQYDYKKDINLIVTNNYEKELLKYFRNYKNSDCICIFLNKTDSINSIINTLGIADKSKVFCSKESADKLKKLEFNTYEHLDLPLAKYNFFTSRFYSAVDIKLTSKKTPDILILTDKHPYTRVDPKTQVIQIYGRFRNGFKSLTHIAQCNDKIKVSEDYELEQELEIRKEMYQEIEALKSKYMFSFTDIPDNAIRGQLEKLDYTKYLDENNQLNYFAVDNMFYDNEVNSYYKSPEALKEAYDNTKHFNFNYKCVIDDNLLNVLNLKELSVKEQRIGIVNQLELLETGMTNGTINQQKKSDLIKFLKQVDDFIVEVYYTLGKIVIDKYKFSQSKLEKVLEKEKKERYRISLEVALEIYANFESREDTYIDKNTIQKEVTTIYNRLGIDYKVKKKTIEDYYDKPKISNSKKTPSYKLEGRKIIK